MSNHGEAVSQGNWGPPYLLYLGGAADELAIKTARGLAVWRPDWCIGQCRPNGTKVTLNLPDWTTRVNLGNKGQYEFCIQGTAAENNDPDGLGALIDGELPPSMSRSFGIPAPRIHDLLAAGRAEFDPAKRKAIYAEMGALVAQVSVAGSYSSTAAAALLPVLPPTA